jgi:hypothetical protein
LFSEPLTSSKNSVIPYRKVVEHTPASLAHSFQSYSLARRAPPGPRPASPPGVSESVRAALAATASLTQSSALSAQSKPSIILSPQSLSAHIYGRSQARDLDANPPLTVTRPLSPHKADGDRSNTPPLDLISSLDYLNSQSPRALAKIREAQAQAHMARNLALTQPQAIALVSPGSMFALDEKEVKEREGKEKEKEKRKEKAVKVERKNTRGGKIPQKRSFKRDEALRVERRFDEIEDEKGVPCCAVLRACAG